MYEGEIEVGETYEVANFGWGRTVKLVDQDNVFYIDNDDGSPGGCPIEEFREVVTAPLPPDPFIAFEKAIVTAINDLYSIDTARMLETALNTYKKERAAQGK